MFGHLIWGTLLRWQSQKRFWKWAELNMEFLHKWDGRYRWPIRKDEVVEDKSSFIQMWEWGQVEAFWTAKGAINENHQEYCKNVFAPVYTCSSSDDFDLTTMLLPILVYEFFFPYQWKTAHSKMFRTSVKIQRHNFCNNLKHDHFSLPGEKSKSEFPAAIVFFVPYAPVWRVIFIWRNILNPGNKFAIHNVIITNYCKKTGLLANVKSSAEPFASPHRAAVMVASFESALWRALEIINIRGCVFHWT